MKTIFSGTYDEIQRQRNIIEEEEKLHRKIKQLEADKEELQRMFPSKDLIKKRDELQIENQRLREDISSIISMSACGIINKNSEIKDKEYLNDINEFAKKALEE